MIILFTPTACGGSQNGTQPESAPNPNTASVTLAWDPVPAKDLAGYRIYQSISPRGTMTLSGTVSASTVRFTVGDLQKGTTYYFVVRAYDLHGNESSNSNQVSWTAPPP
jgi:hypothetical protein